MLQWPTIYGLHCRQHSQATLSTTCVGSDGPLLDSPSTLKPQHASVVLVVVDTWVHSTTGFYVLFGCPTVPLSLKLYEPILYLFTNLMSKRNIRACFSSLFLGETLQRQRWDVFQLVFTSLLWCFVRWKLYQCYQQALPVTKRKPSGSVVLSWRKVLPPVERSFWQEVLFPLGD